MQEVLNDVKNESYINEAIEMVPILYRNTRKESAFDSLMLQMKLVDEKT